MKIAVLSDTHLRPGQALPPWVWEECAKADLILHAGDVVCLDLLTDLEQISPVVAVQGNCDGWELAHLPERKIITCEEVKIGLTHGAYGFGSTTPERAKRTFEEDKVDVVVFGHSHIPYLEKQGELLLFNPGSPTNKRREPRYSMGIMEIEGRTINARHIYG